MVEKAFKFTQATGLATKTAE